MWYILETWKAYEWEKWKSILKKWGKKPHSLEISDGILKVFSNCLCLAQLGKLSQFRTSLEHVVLCCWWSISVTWSWASHIWMGLGTFGNALSELRALFRGFHALAEVEKVYLENKECSLLHWFCVCLCVCSKSSVGHMRNVEYKKSTYTKYCPHFHMLQQSSGAFLWKFFMYV